MRRLPVAAVGMVATMAMVGGPKSPMRSSGREPSTAIASLGQVRAAGGTASEVGRDGKDEPQTVVTPQWLHDRLESDTKIKVVDASWYMPNEKRDTLKEYKEGHIPGAVFFDLEKISDVTSDMPHMLPSEAAFEQAASALGIQNDDWLVVYDTKGLFSAARVWWMFRVFGHEKVWILDGGLPNWKASGFPTKSEGPQLLRGEEAVAAVQKVYSGKEVPKSQYKATLQPHLVWSVEQVKGNLQDKEVQVIDARGKPRFDGTVPEPRKGVRGGHIPGSKCVPFPEVLSPSGTLLTPEELGSKFKNAGVSTEGPIVASCGTGVTACILALALHRMGKQDVAVYDGSWTEWGSRSDTPVETNAPTAA
ncbi:hypothetical protein KC19_7G119900 [Ceratodon purpureus]|nr:hypothetical protein KC19_7G119900 [Ceratodon purpureus]